ncbi:PHD and RING finger domain-containing protein 1 isoform 2-T2 [Ctenodactylus gundi]
MDEDNLDEVMARSPGPEGCPVVGSADVASGSEETSDGHSGDSEDDIGSENGEGTGGEDEEGPSEEEDPEDRSGSEDSEDEVEALVAAVDSQGNVEASGILTSDDDAENCPICLNVFRDQAVGTPETCAHYFCLDCIVEWSRNANSCPVDRTIFKCICIRAQFGGKILKKIPVENTRPCEEVEEEDPTFCEVCGRSDREDRLLLCDGCDAGYHMECLDPPLQEVPVDEWFCPECAAPGTAPAADAGPVTEEEVSLLLADMVPTTSRLRPHAGRTRAIARTRQSERVRATVNRNRISTARRVQHVPRYLMSSLLDETIEAVATGLSTAIYQRPLTARAPARRKRKTGRRKKVPGRKKTPYRSSVKSKSTGAKSKKRQHRVKKRKGKKIKNEVTARSRIARTLGLCRPTHGASIPSVCKPADMSLGLMRADIGAATLSLFGDPYELDPFDSEEVSANPSSPLSAKRKILSRSALQSHQPVARPVSMGLSRRQLPGAAPGPDVEDAPVPDLLGSILSSQSLLMMNSADIVIHRDGSLSAKRAAPVSLQRNSVSMTRKKEGSTPADNLQTRAPLSWSPSDNLAENQLQSFELSSGGRLSLPHVSARTAGPRVHQDLSPTPGSSQAQNLSNGNASGLRQSDIPQFNGSSKQVLPLGSASLKSSSRLSNSLPKSTSPGQAPKPPPRRGDISELPRIPKIHRDCSGSGWDVAPARGQSVEIPSTCISHLTGREGSGQPGRGRAESEPSSKGPKEPSCHAGGSRPPPPSSHGSLAPLGTTRGKSVGSTFESFRINIPGNTAQCSQLSSPGFCNTFRPVDSKVQRKESSSPLFSIKKTKQLKSEIYDPFEPTGSDSSPPSSSPESLGPGLLPSEITRTISINSPKAPAFQAVRCVTSYTVEGDFEMEPEPLDESASHICKLQGEESAKEASDVEREALGEKQHTRTQCLAIRPQRPSLLDPWDDEDEASHGTFFGSEERTVTCVTVLEPGDQSTPDAPQATTHRIVELRAPSRSRSRSRSTSSSRSRKKPKRKKVAREHRRSRSRTRSGSRDRTSRSASPVVEEHTRRHRAKAKIRRYSSDRASSQERTKRRKAKDRGKERRRSSWGRRKSRSRSGTPRSSSCERYESRRKKRHRSGSRSWGRDCSPPSSLERARRHRHQRERSHERLQKKESVSRSREKRKWRSGSPSSEYRARESRQPSSHEKKSHSPEKKGTVKEASPAPLPQEEPRQDGEQPARPAVLAEVGVISDVLAEQPPPPDPPVLEVPAECAPEDLDYGDSVEAGHVFEDFSSEAIFIQLDDMSSPPSPESTDSSPEEDFPPNPLLPRSGLPQDTTLAAIQREVSLIHGEDVLQPPAQAEGLPEQRPLRQDMAETPTIPPNILSMVAVGKDSPSVSGRAQEAVRPEEVGVQAPLLRSRALVKRVTWNLQESEGSTLALNRDPRAPLHRPQRPQEGAWDTEDGVPMEVKQAVFPEPPPPSHVLLEPGIPDMNPSQVYSHNMPPALAQPSSVLPYTLVSQPSVQFILQGSLPLVGCGTAQSLAPVPTMLATTSEPVSQATANNNSLEEKTATPRPAMEKTKKEEYMKKLHMQERAVEEVKLAIKPFYQKREVTKEEYKDILRKAVQKICHSKSGEINPVKVANLVKAYVDKYRHMRKHRKAEAVEEPPATGAEA